MTKVSAYTWLAHVRDLAAGFVRHTTFLNSHWWLLLLIAALGLFAATLGTAEGVKPAVLVASMVWGSVLFLRTACECLRWLHAARVLSLLGFALLMGFAFSIVQDTAAGWSVLAWFCGAGLSYGGLHGAAAVLGRGVLP